MTEQVSTRCFQKKPKEENDSRNRVDRYDDRHDEYDREKVNKFLLNYRMLMKAC